MSSSTHDQIVNARSNPECFLVHIHNSSCRSEEISTNQQRQAFRRNHAENDSALLASNKNGSRHSGQRDQCTTITKCIYLSFTSFIDLVFQTKVFQQALVICPPVSISVRLVPHNSKYKCFCIEASVQRKLRHDNNDDIGGRVCIVHGKLISTVAKCNRGRSLTNKPHPEASTTFIVQKVLKKTKRKERKLETRRPHHNQRKILVIPWASLAL